MKPIESRAQDHLLAHQGESVVGQMVGFAESENMSEKFKIPPGGMLAGIDMHEAMTNKLDKQDTPINLPVRVDGTFRTLLDANGYNFSLTLSVEQLEHIALCINSHQKLTDENAALKRKCDELSAQLIRYADAVNRAGIGGQVGDER